MSDLLVAPADTAAREQALDITRSVIVQAPAGSGKTDLLTRRFLRLLAAVNEPEEILAITFTRAATAEMRNRILRDLEAAAGLRGFRPEEISRVDLARQALAHAERRGWRLLEQPQRLTIETIDSLCLRIAHDQPLLARLGGQLQPTEDAEPLYALAARRTLEHLGGSDAALDQALAHVLDLRDNRLAECQSLLAGMLRVRDQWQHAFPLAGDMSEDDWAEARSSLEAPFRREVRHVLDHAYRLLNSQPAVSEHLLRLANYACGHGNEKLSLLAGLESLSPSMPLAHWKCLCEFLLTADGEWRRAVDKRTGFPAASKEGKQQKQAMLDLLGWLQHVPGLRAALCAIRDLPPVAYSEEQWMTLRHIFTVLRRAIAELRIVFAEHNQVDFTEIALAALITLRDNPAGLGEDIRHLLIDEFQDTSRRQHELVSLLLAAWEEPQPSVGPGDNRTVFLVGDPMQSIYMFRQAEVELFSHVRDHGLGHDCIRCEPVQLTVNFRSHAGLVEPINDIFRAVGAEPAPPGAAAVPFVDSVAAAAARPEQSLHVWPQILGTPDTRPTPAERAEAQGDEARQVLSILERHLPAIERARASDSEYRVAVLVRARPHLAQLVPLLRERGIPFRAVEIERLAERQEMRDLLSLTRALLHPMDRVAWLSVLRAPWCGLTLSDLHRLTGSDDRSLRHAPVLELVERHQHRLSADGQRRLERTAGILREALDLRWRASQSPSLASWIERTWRTLGGDACIDPASTENVEVFFSLLDGLAPDGLSLFSGEFDAQIEKLFAQPDPSVSETAGIQLMTIHKAKGLGFDVVIVPGLDRRSSSDTHPLVCSLERRSPRNSAEDEFLVAPLGLKGEETDPLYKWVTRQRRIRFDEERRRLFYVACTRARRELHLLGAAVATATGVRPESPASLLATAWPALQRDFEAAARQTDFAPVARILPFPPLPSLPLAGRVDTLAAVADASLTLRRLTLAEQPGPAAANVAAAGSALSGQPEPPIFLRPQGSRHSRLIGTTVHALLQRLGPQLAVLEPNQVRERAVSLLRASALAGEALEVATETVTNMLLACAADPVFRWILAPHPGAQSEAAFSGLDPESGRLRTVRVDRLFRGGPEPLAEGEDFLWIVDYKTGAPSGDREAFLAAERALYAPQLQAYAHVLRALDGAKTPLRLGLCYPAVVLFDYWDPDRA